MQQTITITELLRNHKQITNMVSSTNDPISVISNSKIIFDIVKHEQKTQKKHTRVRFQGKITGKIDRGEIYNKSWLDK